jgi:hypothetical protein
VSQNNVVSFVAFARGRSARRGADDKLPFEKDETVEVECPRCAAVLRLEVDALSGAPEAFCAACDATISFRADVVDVGGV